VRFWSQPIRAHRDLWIVTTLVGAHLLAVAWACVVAPWSLVDGFRDLWGADGQWYAVSEYSHLWRMFAFGGLLAFATGAFAAAANPLHGRAVFVPVGAMVLGTSAGLVWTWARTYRYAPLLGVAVWLIAAFALLLWSRRRACRAIVAAGAGARSSLVPRLFFAEPS